MLGSAQMKRIARSCVAVALTFSVMILASCRTTQGVHLLNETGATVSVTAVIENEHGRQELNLTIPPDLSDGWQYSAYPWEASGLHATFKALEASSDEGCRLRYDRRAIESAVEPRTRKDDIWLIVVDREACGLE